MRKNDILFRALSLVCLAIIPLYPNIAYALINHAGISYIVTGIIFSLPIIAILSLIRQKWLYYVLTSILTILALTDLTMVDLYKEYLLPGGIISTIKTNPQEAAEFYSTNFREVFLWIPLILICIVSCVLYRPSVNRKISTYVALSWTIVFGIDRHIMCLSNVLTRIPHCNARNNGRI